jgi:uncharacterized protein DUF3309
MEATELPVISFLCRTFLAPEEAAMGLILLILLIVLLLAAVPAWPYSRGWGYYPSGGLGIILIIIIVLLIAGYI